jgi:putative transposase
MWSIRLRACWRAARFHRLLECLNETLFSTLHEARRIIEAWRLDYNNERPHTSLNGLTPNEFASRSNEDHNQNGVYL